MPGRPHVSSSEEATLRVWDLETGREQLVLRGHHRGVTGCAVTPDGRRLIASSRDESSLQPSNSDYGFAPRWPLSEHRCYLHLPSREHDEPNWTWGCVACFRQRAIWTDGSQPGGLYSGIR
jgi:WD40 repeat protein